MPSSFPQRLPLNELILATRNPKKLREYKTLLKGVGLHILPITQLAKDFAPTEDEESFEANALKKAKAAFMIFGRPVLAEDSGLSIDALDGAPGVISARFAADDRARCRKVLRLLSGVEPARRTARFRCVAVLLLRSDDYRIFEGICEGRIAEEIAGRAGFGYDPIFIPTGYSQTFAQLGMKAKNRLSHRARAVEKLKQSLISGHGAAV